MNQIQEVVVPFLRWAGGKTWLLKYLKEFLPSYFNDYYEPFVGSGAVFFSIKPSGFSYLSDENQELINAYNVVKNNCEELICELDKYTNTEEEYYIERNIEYKCNIKSAARFIYLNRTSFNGIYRVNLRGKYNVPYGYKKYRQLFDYDNLRFCSNALSQTIIEKKDFYRTLENIKKGDLVFIDPPYTVTHVKNGFVKYNEKIFSWADQERLADYIDKIDKAGAYFILTNAAHPTILELFGNVCEPATLSRASVIGGDKAKRGIFEEYVFCNLRR